MYRLVVVILTLALIDCVQGAILKEINPKIVGGKPASEGQFPHQVSLRLTESNEHFCGGVIINKFTILTAAHCLAGSTVTNMLIVAGTNQLGNSGQIYFPTKFIIHSEFNFFTLLNDIALIRVDRNIEMSDLVQSISIENEFIDGGATVRLSGWGSTILGGDAPEYLQTIDLLTITNEKCKALIGIPIPESQICTLTIEGEGACHGDSGSALIKNHKVVGIVSWGRPCANGYPDAYSRASSYIDWINYNKFE